MNRFVGCGMDRTGSVMNSRQHDNKTSGLMKGGEFLDHISDHQTLKNDSDPWRSLREME
jgi:hypothetical protein